MINKGIKLYCDYEPYYGINLHYWVVEKEKCQTKESFIEDLKKIYKDNSYLRNVMDAGDLFDFLDTLKNGLNGDELYNNVVENLVWLDEFRSELYKENINDEFDKIALRNLHQYDDSDALSIFGVLTPYLSNNDKFKDWLFKEVKRKNYSLYEIIINPKEGKKKRIEYLNEMIEHQKENISYYEGRIIELEKEIKSLVGGSNEQ